MKLRTRTIHFRSENTAAGDPTARYISKKKCTVFRLVFGRIPGIRVHLRWRLSYTPSRMSPKPHAFPPPHEFEHGCCCVRVSVLPWKSRQNMNMRPDKVLIQKTSRTKVVVVPSLYAKTCLPVSKKSKLSGPTSDHHLREKSASEDRA